MSPSPSTLACLTATLSCLGLGDLRADGLSIGPEFDLGTVEAGERYDVACNAEVCAVVHAPLQASGAVSLVLLAPDASAIESRTDLAPDGSRPLIAAGDDGFLVVWLRGVPSGFELLAQALGPAGQPVGAPGTLSAAISNGDGDLAWDGTRYRLTWGFVDAGDADIHQVRSARVDPAGQLLGEIAVVDSNQLGEQSMAPSLSCWEGACAALWTDAGLLVRGARLDAAGGLGGAPEAVLPGATGSHHGPHLAATSAGYPTIWTEDRDGTTHLMHATLPLAGGIALAPTAIQELAVGVGNSAAVAAALDNTLVTWIANLDGQEILTATLLAAAGPRPAQPITTSGAMNDLVVQQVAPTPSGDFVAVFLRASDSASDNPPAQMAVRRIVVPDDVKPEGGDAGGCAAGDNLPSWPWVGLALLVGRRRLPRRSAPSSDREARRRAP